MCFKIFLLLCPFSFQLFYINKFKYGKSTMIFNAIWLKLNIIFLILWFVLCFALYMARVYSVSCVHLLYICLSVHHTIHWGIIEPFKAHSSNFRHCVSNWTVSLTFTISLMHYSSCLPKNSSILKQFKIFPRNTVSYVLDKTNWWEQFKCEMGLVADLNYPSDPKVTSNISLTWQPNVIFNLVIL